MFNTTDLGYKLVLLACLAALIPLGALVVWHDVAPGGKDRMTRNAAVALESAYDAGRYDEVLRFYETPVPVRFHSDRALAEQRGADFDLVHVMAADAYAHRGDEETATAVYLAVLGWNEAEYRSLCALSDSCHDLAALRLAASQLQ